MTVRKAQAKKGGDKLENTNDLGSSEAASAIPMATAVPVDDTSATAVAVAVAVTPVALAVQPAPQLPRQQPSGVVVNVIAPASLPEGSTLSAVVDGITFTAVVPKGGVREGQSFRVPYPSGDHYINNNNANSSIYNSNYSHPNNNNYTGAQSATEAGDAPFRVPTGRWRQNLCDCCDSSQSNCCDICCMACMCGFVVHAQIMQRLKLTLGGCPRRRASINQNNNHKTTPVCPILVGTSGGLMLFFLGFIITGYLPGIIVMELVLLVWWVAVFVIMVCTRRSMRMRYDLPAISCCGRSDDCCDDCCTTALCLCCSAIQMASHTHDRNIYLYDCCSPTGLSNKAPEVPDV